MPYTGIYSTYRDEGPALGDCICHTLAYKAHTGMWGLLWGTLYAIHWHIQHIHGWGPCSRGLYMPYTAIYSTYREVWPALGDCICHTLAYKAHTGMWGLLWGTLYAIHWHIKHIQGWGPCSRGLYIPYTGIYSTYRDVGPALGDCICYTLAYTAHTWMGALLWGLCMPYTDIYSTYRDVGPTLGTLYAIHLHIQHIQGCGACCRELYMPYTDMPYTAIYSTYRDVGPALGDCTCHTLPYTAHTGMWALLRGLYIPYTAIYSTYRDVGPTLGDSMCHILPYTADTGMWALL